MVGRQQDSTRRQQCCKFGHRLVQQLFFMDDRAA
jgi:hypothetical protein